MKLPALTKRGAKTKTEPLIGRIEVRTNFFLIPFRHGHVKLQTTTINQPNIGRIEGLNATDSVTAVLHAGPTQVVCSLLSYFALNE